jgi:predicted GNAT family acetyltransferase
MQIHYSFDINAFDFETVHQWLSTTYWSAGITKERIIQGFQNTSIVIGAFSEGHQVGVARCITDTTRFAYIADVFVSPEHRGKGIARQMVKALLSHPKAADADRAILFTQDAHGVYQSLGFGPHEHPEHLMVRRKPKQGS